VCTSLTKVLGALDGGVVQWSSSPPTEQKVVGSNCKYNLYDNYIHKYLWKTMHLEIRFFVILATLLLKLT
jgi:hypothetical protein